MENVLALYSREALPTRARICFDERPCQLLDDGVATLLVKPGKVANEDNEYVRQGTGVVLLAYDGTGHPAGQRRPLHPDPKATDKSGLG